jgi:hypothetical protein
LFPFSICKFQAPKTKACFFIYHFNLFDIKIKVPIAALSGLDKSLSFFASRKMVLFFQQILKESDFIPLHISNHIAIIQSKRCFSKTALISFS